MLSDNNSASKYLPTSSCAIIKTNGIFGSRPLKRLPQTNLIHKKKTKRLYMSPSLSIKQKVFCTLAINLYTKVKITSELKTLLDKIMARNPRCKIFRDLYYENSFEPVDCIYSYVFCLDSEYPIQETPSKKVYELVIISSKQVLIYDEKFTCIDNDNLVIFHSKYPPRFKELQRARTSMITEYNFIQLPGLSNRPQVMITPKFVSVFTPKRKLSNK